MELPLRPIPLDSSPSALINKPHPATSVATLDESTTANLFPPDRHGAPPLPSQAHQGLLKASRKTPERFAERLGRDKAFHVLPPFISPVDSPLDRPSTPHAYVLSQMPEHVSNTESGNGNDNDNDNGNGRSGPDPSSRHRPTGDGQEERISAGHVRSRSKTGNGAQLDNKIETTMATLEPNARSRKTSHSLGLFKENAASLEQRKRDDRPKDRRGKEQSIKEQELTLQGHANYGPTPADVDDGSAAASTPTPRQSQPAEPSHAERLSKALQPAAEIRQNTPTSRSSKSSGPGESEPFVEPSDRLRPHSLTGRQTSLTDTTQALPTAKHNLPLSLLEEIRTHHNVTPGAGQGTSFSKSLPTFVSEQSRTSLEATKASDKAGHVQSTAQRQTLLPPKAISDEEDDEDDSEKDEISSALYFPHQTPTIQAIEEVPSTKRLDPETSHLHQSFDTDPSSFQGRPTETDAAKLQQEDLELSIQSDKDNSLLREEITTLKPPQSDSSGRTISSSYPAGPVSASESEYESWDDPVGSRGYVSSFTDDADITPSATPLASTLVSTPKPRRLPPTAPAPLGAVELKPYNHQVGGHTTVFRFSRRAVCKSLSNRENEFYETVERRHPELLGFLPRYVAI